ncbi:PSD1 and planctomycete cytochrome C domain-containing protein [Novipirellula artificiosorum]|nr:PSD1 and planctomycete cytochrome C domain-containing protein [Novipirellula artificiosorum]
MSPHSVSAQEVSFNRDIRPLLSDRCFACHGPDAESRESGLRLDQPGGDEGAIGFVIEPGSVADSEMWNRITTDDESEIMPPPDSHLKPLSKQELSLVRRWIESGAEYEGYWAFEPPALPDVPVVKDPSWSEQTIDLHVLKKLESMGRLPAAEADSRTLIRRVTFDLTGLPPTRAEIAQFLDEQQQSPDQAWEQLVDRLLSRPQYGEHVGRYWLDLVRFADSAGMHKDFYRNHVAYRDWVIRSFNANLGYDDFLRYQLAGDLYPHPSQDQLIASGFNRLHLIIDVGTALPEESFSKNVIDRVTSVGTAFMGLTVHCAQCHDHKFDPITQQDFYSLSAFFNNIDAQPETVSGRGPKMGLQPPFISLATPDQRKRIDEFDQAIAQLEELKKLAAEVEAEKELLALSKRLEQGREKFDESIPKAMVMKEREEIRPTFILQRGQYDAPGAEVSRNTPKFFSPLKKSGEVASRLDLAEWFVDPSNPLTARVAVNRFWQQCFGVGLVKTSEDFGNQGDVPSHPELLDYLAVSFRESGWDVKALLKQVVMSKTYRQSSIATPEEFKADAENRLLARGSRYRLDAEMIRDQILATSGLLSDNMYGPSVKPPQPKGLWQAVSMIGERYQPDTGEATHRRSVYTFWKRSMPPPQMTILNAPLRDACIARRERTNTPTQALLLLNEPEYLRAARELAVLTLKQPAGQRLDFVWETVSARLPDKNEKAVLEELLVDLKAKYSANPALANELCQGIEWSAEESTAQQNAEVAAWTILGNVVYNLDITKTKD